MSLFSYDTTCCFTGHRPNKMPWGDDETDPRCVNLKKRLYNTAETVAKSGVTHFICGMASGCDLYFCEAVLKLRAKMDTVTVEAAIPWAGQSDRWVPSLRKHYQLLRSACDYETIIQPHYDSGCMMRRNRYMVDNSSALIAVYNGTPGGTMNTMLYAMRKKLKIIEISIDPP